MKDRKKCMIWICTLLLLAMLTTVYIGVDAIYRNAIPHISQEYRAKALAPLFLK